MIIPVILSGGTGSRLWPLSRKQFPKQFHSLFSDRSLLQDTALRATHATAEQRVIVVANAEHKFLVREQLLACNLEGYSIILEPVARNTAPAAALAALHVCETYGDATLLVMPSDHVIPNIDAFKSVVQSAASIAMQGRLVTFGIQPTAPECGYGYISRGSALSKETGPVYSVTEFVEKPDASTAQHYLSEGTYYWNSGIFMFTASAFLRELESQAPMILQKCQQSLTARGGNEKKHKYSDESFVTVDTEAFSDCPSDSIDYAVMEGTKSAVVIPFSEVWSDVGSWPGLSDIMRNDFQGNVNVGDIYTRDVKNTYIQSSGRLVVAIGLEDSVVVETADAVLVATKEKAQQVKDIVERLSADSRQEIDTHTLVYRPWGSYQSFEQGDHFQVKKLTIKPGASISLQRHHRRSEHWIVIRGAAHVTRGQEEFVIQENESTYIPKETMHKLENKGGYDLEIIEIQTGEYFGEDDIERFEDQYGRI